MGKYTFSPELFYHLQSPIYAFGKIRGPCYNTATFRLQIKNRKTRVFLSDTVTFENPSTTPTENWKEKSFLKGDASHQALPGSLAPAPSLKHTHGVQPPQCAQGACHLPTSGPAAAWQADVKTAAGGNQTSARSQAESGGQTSHSSHRAPRGRPETRRVSSWKVVSHHCYLRASHVRGRKPEELTNPSGLHESSHPQCTPFFCKSLRVRGWKRAGCLFP